MTTTDVFVGEVLELAPFGEAPVAARDLYRRYWDWCRARGERVESAKKLAASLGGIGAFAVRKAKGNFYPVVVRAPG